MSDASIHVDRAPRVGERFYYGWVVLGVSALWSARTRAARIAVGAPLLVLLFTMASMPALPL